MRKIILNLAISLDGFIADENGGFEWIVGDGDNSQDTEKQFNFDDFLESVDTLVMGKKAYDDCPKETLDMFNNKTIFVATRSEMINKPDNVITMSGNISQHIQAEQKLPGKDIYLWGGAGVVDDLIKSDIIDEYIIGLIPTILGKGRPLFLENNPTINLHLLETTSKDGIVILKYEKRKS